MAAFSPADIMKDHKNALLPVLAAVILIIAIGMFYGEGGDYWGGSKIGEEIGEIGKSGKNTYDSPPRMQLEDGVDYSVTIKTNHGDIEVDLLEDNAPRTVNNFVFLSNENFYDGLMFHRVVKGFVIQGGDPEGNGTGGPGYTFDDEINPNSIGLDDILVKDALFLEQLYSTWNAATVGYAPNSLREHANDTLAEFYDDVIGYDYDYSLQSVRFSPGVMAMANSGPNSNGSQFFITVSGSDTGNLGGRHTVFGRVTSGMDVVDEIASVKVDQANKPLKSVEIEGVVIHED